MKLISVFLTDEQIKKLKSLARKTGLKVAEHIRRAIDEYLIKKLIIIISVTALLIALPSITSASDSSNKWTWEDTGFQVIYSGLLIADWTQTLHVARNPYDYSESNKFLGEYSAKKRINSYFAVALIGHPFFSYLLDKPYRTIWQATFIVIEYNAVQHNRRIGIGVSLHY